MSDLAQNVGKALVRYRRVCKMTQVQLAKKMGFLNQTQISSYERGQYLPDAEHLVKIADYLGVSVDYLLGRETADSYKRGFNDACSILSKFAKEIRND